MRFRIRIQGDLKYGRLFKVEVRIFFSYSICEYKEKDRLFLKKLTADPDTKQGVKKEGTKTVFRVLFP
jgi:hypothetical protein